MMLYSNTSRVGRLLLSAALAALLPLQTGALAGPRQAQVDVAALMDDGAPGDADALQAALPHVHGKAEAALLRAGIATTRLDIAAARAALDAWTAAADRDVRRQAIAWSIRSDLAFAEGDYAGAAAAIGRWLALPASARRGDEADNMTQALGIARLLAGEKRQTVIGGTPGTMATARDKAGLVRATVMVDGVAQDAVLDTGANLSVVSASTAKRMGLRLIEGEASVGSSSASHVPTRLAVADRLVIAGVTLTNVVFLVLDDSRLSFPVPGGYTIDAIIGFPVFRALGRVRFDRSGGFAAGDAAGPAGAQHGNLRASGNDLYVLANIDGTDAALHLDSGASHSTLSAAFAKKHGLALAGLESDNRQMAGAGGNVVAQPTVHWKQVALAAGGRTLTLPDLVIVTGGDQPDDEHRLGVLGQDVLGAFESWTLDFRTMSFELGAPRPRS